MLTGDTPNLIMTVITIMFYLISGIFIIASCLAVYSLLNFSRGKSSVLVVAGSYVMLALILLGIALGQLHHIKLS